MNVPYLPKSAPFTAEQRAYLNGLFAGLFSQAAVAPAPVPAAPLTILFGSQTGNAEALAKRAAKEAAKHSFAATVHDIAQYPRQTLTAETNLLLITSTYGDGDPPDNAREFWQFLSGTDAPRLPNVRFSVLALGDSNYPKFCECGKNFDRRLEELGAQRIHPRMDCNGDPDETFKTWINSVLPALGSAAVPKTISTHFERCDNIDSTSKRSRAQPFPARLLTNRLLNEGSAKETRHFEISLEGSDLTYEVGDALGVVPANCPAMVDDIVKALGCSGDETVGVQASACSGGNRDMLKHELQPTSLRKALLCDYDITKISGRFLQAVAERSQDETLKRLASPGVNGELTKFLWGRQLIDLLVSYSGVAFAPAEFVGLLNKLQPRLYSISSSPKVHAGQVHLTVSIVRYESLGRRRKGVCSAFLAERVQPDTPLPVFLQKAKHFRLPRDGSKPIIMVGPGTGIAPFRAFLHERRALGATGKSWLFFGDQHQATDFLYRDELQAMLRDGGLSRLDTAFSRDQSEKVYVQHRMLEHARELFAWLEDGAHFYVCGDATRMAKDVDQALRQIIESGGGRSAEAAAEYVAQLKKTERYQRDVY